MSEIRQTRMERRAIVGFAVAPAIIPLLLVTWALAHDVHARESIVIGSIYAAFTYGAAIMFGLPVYVLFSRKGWTRYWQYAAVGGGIGAAVLLVISATAGQSVFTAPAVLIFAGIGVLSATVFWAITVHRASAWRGHPNRRPLV